MDYISQMLMMAAGKSSISAELLAVAHDIYPYLTVYERSGNTFTKLPNPSDLPPDTCYDVAFSADGTYLAVAHASSPYLTIYKQDQGGGSFTKLANPSILPTGIGNGVALSADGTFLAVAHATSPYLTIYKRDQGETTFSKLANPSDLPTSSGNDVAISPDGINLAVACDTSPYLFIYKLNVDGETYTKRPDQDWQPGGKCYAVDFSPAGTYQYLSATFENSPYINTWRISGDSFTDQYQDNLPNGPGSGIAVTSGFSYYLALAQRNPYYLQWWVKSTRYSDPVNLAPGPANDVAISETDKCMVLAHDGYPYISIYEPRPGYNPTLEPFPTPSVLPTGECFGVAFSQ